MYVYPKITKKMRDKAYFIIFYQGPIPFVASFSSIDGVV